VNIPRPFRISSRRFAKRSVLVRYISPDPDVTKNAFDSEGFFRTGDLGKIEDGVVYLLGRASQDGIDASFLLRICNRPCTLANYRQISYSILSMENIRTRSRKRAVTNRRNRLCGCPGRKRLGLWTACRCNSGLSTAR
jgi:acyl-CoA synthetase (AMP-forming)/AMP-acid ligase II